VLVKRVGALFAIAAASGGVLAAAAIPSEAERLRLVPWSPALAAIAFEIGLGSNVVGITTWTSLPAGESRPVVGDAHSVHLEALLAVRPHLVVLQGEPPAGLQEAQKLQPALRVERVELERLADIPRVARRLHAWAGGTSDRLPPAIEEFERTIEHYRARRPPLRRPRVLFVVGTERSLVGGPETFVGEMIALAGGENAANGLPGRHRWNVVGIEHLSRSSPDLVIVHAPASECTAAEEWWRRRWAGLGERRVRVVGVSDPSWVQPSLQTAMRLVELAELLEAAATSWPAPSGECSARRG